MFKAIRDFVVRFCTSDIRHPADFVEPPRVSASEYVQMLRGA